jgi:hemerythrin superfamily protein
MPTARSKSASAVRSQILGELKDDHKRVKKAYRDFQKLDPSEDAQACEELVTQVLDELTLHAAIEEELLYPAAREAIADEHLVDEAEVEHEAMHSLIDQLRQMGPEDEKYAARFTVLCEYTLHHVKEEEGEMFPQLEKARLDWDSLAAEIRERRAELSGAAGREAGAEADDAEGEDAAGAEPSAGEDATSMAAGRDAAARRS